MEQIWEPLPLRDSSDIHSENLSSTFPLEVMLEIPLEVSLIFKSKATTFSFLQSFCWEHYRCSFWNPYRKTTKSAFGYFPGTPLWFPLKFPPEIFVLVYSEIPADSADSSNSFFSDIFGKFVEILPELLFDFSVSPMDFF